MLLNSSLRSRPFLSLFMKSHHTYLQKSLATLVEKRNPNFATLNDRDLNFFELLIGKNRTITDSNTLNAYNSDWLRTCKGNSKLTLLPKTTDELSAIIKYCNEKQLAVCPQGGNTGRESLSCILLKCFYVYSVR